jgi:hypothetical protein
MASKIIKAKGKAVSTVEENVAKALTELQATNELKALENLHFVAAKEVDVAGGKKAIIVFTPYRLHKKFQALQPRLGRELEKKFANTHFIFIAQRTILSTSVRPHSPSTSLFALCDLVPRETLLSPLRLRPPKCVHARARTRRSAGAAAPTGLPRGFSVSSVWLISR